jgi:hypothetical protein
MSMPVNRQYEDERLPLLRQDEAEDGEEDGFKVSPIQAPTIFAES